MTDEETKKRATLAFIEGFDELCKEVDKDYKKLLSLSLSLSLSLEDILKKIEEYEFNHEIKWRNLENDLFVPYKLADRIDICQARQKIFLSDAGRGLTSISLALNKIKKSTCNQCKEKLTKDNCYVYLRENKNIDKWALENANKFGSEDFNILFCSENCFKQSIYYQNKTNQQSSTTNSKKKKEGKSKPSQPTEQSNQTKKYVFCRNCSSEINPGNTYYHNPKNPQIKLCSQKCYLEYYGEYCLKCKPYKKYLDVYRLEKNDPYGYCWNCYQEEFRKLEELKQKQQSEIQKNSEESLVEKHIINETACKFCLTKLPNKRFFPVCDKDECKKKFWEQGKKNESKANNQVNESNQTTNLASMNENNSTTNDQITNLKTQISQLENQTNPNQNLLKQKKAELKDLERSREDSKNLSQERLNQEKVQEPKNKQEKTNLYLGLGMGILGLGLIGLVMWLFTKNRRKE